MTFNVQRKISTCFSILFFSLIILTHPNSYSKDSPKLSSEFYAGLSMSVLKVLGPTEDRLYSGSGVIIAPGEVLTNCHVVRNSKKLYVMKGALRFNVSGIKINIYRDLCLLEAPTLTLPGATLIKPSEIKVGDMAYFYGYPGGADAFFTEGRISGLHPMENSYVVKTTAGVSSGGSGGGLFDGKGRLIGITTFFSAGHSGGYYALPSDWIEDLRSQTSSKIVPINGLTFWEMPLNNQPTFLRFDRLVSDGNWDDAIKLSTYWINTEPDSFDALLAHGRALLHHDRKEEAIKVLRYARKLSPNDANILFSLKQALTGSKKTRELSEINRKLNEVDPEEVSAGKCNMAC